MSTTTLPGPDLGQRITELAARSPEGRRRRLWRGRTGSVIRHTLMIVACVVMIYPLLWLLGSSFKPTEAIFRNLAILPGEWDWSNYNTGWNSLTFQFGRYMLNSLAIVGGSLLGNLVSCSMAAYAFARLQFRGRRIWFAIMLLTIMLPIHVVIVPQYIMFRELDLVNTFWPLIIPKLLATDAFFIFLMVQFFRGIPRELEEAARLDGCGHARIFLRVMLPLAVPALATTAIFTFIWTWNDFFSQLIFLTSEEVKTAPVALRMFLDSSAGSNWGPMFAMSIVTIVPIFLVFLFGQKYLVRGIATTGIK
ncbi:binding-protein-dependent transport systems inner membrane component [Xylanimonas cellulosilytica DSM 15894]|uniref:Binding-protein-dependent transport systems inner membrane component n=1 Tax=Xylanimonas cellulosilytica (strain DSM 15894 / JCM 12276 / CECT 5975 / KCTC 9989 / LMG 20990 / NBRC 107835 / XIL07) TaxID=446471 RepID=D1BWK6_XYLCX|nr:carbohydrate ABC transporter permease [Xylanimonas cellulosilytica]ACZ31551.1 binding-protein-dependent transport systems inner membrane component [Xylanimonas cellulosilytica DSM 15894]